MNILLIPTVREIYKNQLELSVDHKLINFLRARLKIVRYGYLQKKLYNLKTYSFCGGNSLSKKKS